MKGARNNVKRYLKILQPWFAIIQNLCRIWQMDIINKIMIACVIMHNIIIENDKDNNVEWLFDLAFI